METFNFLHIHALCISFHFASKNYLNKETVHVGLSNKILVADIIWRINTYFLFVVPFKI